MKLYTLFALLLGFSLTLQAQESPSNKPPKPAALLQSLDAEQVKSWLSRVLKPLPKAQPKDKAFVQKFKYEEHIYSTSKKNEIGDQIELDVKIAKQLGPKTKVLVGVEIDPQESTLTSTSSTSSTTRLAIEGQHKYHNFTFNIDLDLDFQTSDRTKATSDDTKGIELGLDSDSEFNFIQYDFNQRHSLKFLPFNFDGEVGEEFNTWDVTRIYSIEGSPNAVQGTLLKQEYIRAKTIPGFMWSFKPTNRLKFSVGGGVQTYFYPKDASFDIASNPSSLKWERREDFGARLDISYIYDHNFRFQLKHVWHDKSKETGSLLESGTSFTAMANFQPIMLGLELGMSVAGERAYRLNSRSTWFKETATFLPLYTEDTNTNSPQQDWKGKTDYAGLIKAGFMFSDTIMPYIYYAYQGEDYIFRELESAHRLRTNTGTQSHGGLHRAGIGAKITAGNIIVSPDVEWRQARNDVFSDNSDLNDDPLLSDYKDTDILFSVTVKYSLNSRQAWSWWTKRGKK